MRDENELQHIVATGRISIISSFPPRSAPTFAACPCPADRPAAAPPSRHEWPAVPGRTGLRSPAPGPCARQYQPAAREGGKFTVLGCYIMTNKSLPTTGALTLASFILPSFSPITVSIRGVSIRHGAHHLVGERERKRGYDLTQKKTKAKTTSATFTARVITLQRSPRSPGPCCCELSR